MNGLNNRIWKLKIWNDCLGQDLVEYALAAGMVSVAAIAGLPALSTAITNTFSRLSSIVTSAFS